MDMVRVSSSNLYQVGYDPASAALETEFTNGTVYRYGGVPESRFLGLLRASSKGQCFHDYIRDRYRFRQPR